ncbi:MAG: hypothetical protein ACI8PB_002503 [Desulforhopalus sp.]|jgi:hypothetical protein
MAGFIIYQMNFLYLVTMFTAVASVTKKHIAAMSDIEKNQGRKGSFSRAPNMPGY